MFRTFFTAMILTLLAGIGTVFGQSDEKGPFNFQCGVVEDTSGGFTLTSLDEDTIGILIIIARGWGDCFG